MTMIGDYIVEFELDRLCNALHHIWSLVRETQLFSNDEIEDMVPCIEDFVPGTIGDDPEKYRRPILTPGLRDIKNIRPFGQPLM
ncbi:MAG: hypothetical protein HYV48_02310 [Candidatus Omnitrophica bacterium]|nr:hypothetical protein [Candidatus Omnitrophota bacterium]